MNGREDQKANDLFFTCSLIEYIGRKTHNKRNVIVNTLGRKELERIYDLADIYHSDNIDRVSEDFIDKCNIPDGDFDNVRACRYAIPSHWDMGKVYKRLILGVAREKGEPVLDALEEVYNSFLCRVIDDYNGSFYYENPGFILECYLTGKIM